MGESVWDMRFALQRKEKVPNIPTMPAVAPAERPDRLLIPVAPVLLVGAASAGEVLIPGEINADVDDREVVPGFVLSSAIATRLLVADPDYILTGGVTNVVVDKKEVVAGFEC